MATAPSDPAPKPRAASRALLIVLSVFLLLTGLVVLGQLTSRPLPQGAPLLSNPLPLAIVSALLVMTGGAVSLAYVMAPQRQTWTAAVVLSELSVAATSLLAVQGAAILVATPARGEWAGLVNMMVLLLIVISPTLVALASFGSLLCLMAMRPERDKPVASWVRLLTTSLALPWFVAVVVVVVGVSSSPDARRMAQTDRIRGGNASVKELAEALQSPQHDVRFWAVMELKQKGPEAKEAVPALVQALHDDQAISWMAAQTLGLVGPDAAPAIPALVEVIRNEQGKGKRGGEGGETPSTFSWLAGDALAKIGPASLPHLIELLGHDDRLVRLTAASALREMGPQAKEAIPALSNALSDPDEMVRRYASVALNRIDGRPVARVFQPDAAGANNEQQPLPQREPGAGWKAQPPFVGDPRNRPPGTVCISFADGYLWLISESVDGRESWREGDRTVEAAMSQRRRYEHALGTQEVRIVETAAQPKEQPAKP